MRQDYRLEALALHEIGPFSDLKLEFKPRPGNSETEKAEVHIFTGPNGCGKSTVLYAIARIFEPFHSPGPLTTRLRDVNSFVDFKSGNQAGGYGIQKPASNLPPPIVQGKFGSYSPMLDDENSGRFFGFGSSSTNRESPISLCKKVAPQITPTNNLSAAKIKLGAFAYSGHRSIGKAELSAIQQVKNPPFENALSFENTVRPQILMQWIANNRAQAALAKAEGDTTDGERYDRALARITDLIRDICDLEIEFKLKRDPLAVAISVSGTTISFDGLPDGLKSIISWVADLSLRLEAIPWESDADPFEQPIILLLDEIDIHLHPKWQRRVLPAVQKLLPNAQIFASTHSPFVIGSVDDAWVYPLPEPASVSGPLVVEGIRSGAGKSYRLILSEVFGVEGEFDIETEDLFVAFYDARKQFLQRPDSANALMALAEKIAHRGEESTQIVARELRQLSRITGKELALA